VTTIEILGATDSPQPTPPLSPRVAILTIAGLVLGGALLAVLAGPEPVSPAPTHSPDGLAIVPEAE